jgi:hypothetical protein
MDNKLSPEDYLQGFHNAHHHIKDETHNTPEWYELAEAGFPMKGIAIAPFRRGGTVKPADSSPTLDRALRLTSPERLAATRVR